MTNLTVPGRLDAGGTKDYSLKTGLFIEVFFSLL